MIVLKFGGTSVGSALRIKNAVSIIKTRQNPIVIVSAMSKVTDALLKAAADAKINPDIKDIVKRHKEVLSELGLHTHILNNEFKELNEYLNGIFLLKEITPRTLDTIVSFGERLSSKIIAEYASTQGLKAIAYNAYDLGLITDDNFQSAEVLPGSLEKLKVSILPKIQKGEIPIITGFIGKNMNGEITTLGRGGSDYSAAIIGEAINASEIEIWTDVNGIMSADPRIVKNAKTIPTVSFDEAAELAYFGAKVLHPKTILPAIRKNIPVRVLNTHEPTHPGTLILRNTTEHGIKAITTKKDITTITIISGRMLLAYGFMSEVFRIFKEVEIPVDMIATSEVSVSVTIENTNRLIELVEKLGTLGDVSVSKNMAILSVVGSGLKHTPGAASKVFTTLFENGINIDMISQGASEINLGVVIDKKDIEVAVIALHKKIFEVDSK